jgi:hypothetical protein
MKAAPSSGCHPSKKGGCEHRLPLRATAFADQQPGQALEGCRREALRYQLRSTATDQLMPRVRLSAWLLTASFGPRALFTAV